ncbi:MAG: hypothetical protein KY460_17195 [Actinobacteria bacterium]|nr:hypothetical protein [Actinomycetota bacterium]
MGEFIWPVIVAGATAAVYVAMSLGRTEEQLWLRSWCPRSHWLRYKLAVVAVHAVVALVGAGIARGILAWRPMPQTGVAMLGDQVSPQFAQIVSWIVDGMSYAVLTEALLRADVTPAHFDPVGQTHGLAAPITDGLRTQLARSAKLAITSYLQALEPDDLHALTRRLALRAGMGPVNSMALVDSVNEEFAAIKAAPDSASARSRRSVVEDDAATWIADQHVGRAEAEQWAGTG